ncbi:MAG: hypothetical protein IT428_07015 [Planctomycetaceae bacterium]|nr:hypothetical protein [Planctomycetaceae bacterium]
MLSPQDVEQQEELRAAMKLKIDEARSLQSKRISDMRAVNKELEIARDRQSNDKERIRSHKIGLFVARKEGRA